MQENRLRHPGQRSAREGDPVASVFEFVSYFIDMHQPVHFEGKIEPFVRTEIGQCLDIGRVKNIRRIDGRLVGMQLADSGRSGPIRRGGGGVCGGRRRKIEKTDVFRIVVI